MEQLSDLDSIWRVEPLRATDSRESPRGGSCLGAMPVETSSAILKSFDLLALERLKENSARLYRLARDEANN